MSNFKYQYGENGNTYLVIGDGRLKVKWSDRYVPKCEEIMPGVEIIPSNILLSAENYFKSEVNIKFYPEGIEDEIAFDVDVEDPSVADWLDGAEVPTIAATGISDIDHTQLIVGAEHPETGEPVIFATANIKVKGFLFDQGLETNITFGGYKQFTVDKVYPPELQPGEIEWSIDDPTLGDLEVVPFDPFTCKVSGKGKLGDTVLRLTYKPDPSIAGVCIIHFIEPSY